MKNKPKTIEDLNRIILDRRGEERSALKEGERVMSMSEMIFLHEMKAGAKEMLEKNHLDVWFLQSKEGEGGFELEDIQQLNVFESEYNKKVLSHSDDAFLREYRFKVYDSEDFNYHLKQAYQEPKMIQEIPEVIVIQAKASENDDAWTGISKMISQAIASCMERLNYKNEEITDIKELDRFEAEKKLLRPILVFVSDDPVRQELMRENGADIVLEEFSHEDTQELLEITARIKASAATIAWDKLRRIKAEFYQTVEESLDVRSNITAETAKELEILDNIFQQAGNIDKILDIACGYGRIDIPLLEKGYTVTGVDANEQFLADALRKAFEKNLTKGTFRKGDVIDYTGVVKHGSQDAVIYTWHSILEAFGIGNTLHTLNDAWQALRPGGLLVFDQPTRENLQMADGWYGSSPNGEHHYLSYIMTEEEIRFTLKMACFENVEILRWKTKPSEEYPDGMCKFTISAKKPEVSEDDKKTIKENQGWLKKENE